jgi:hypothetical protein
MADSKIIVEDPEYVQKKTVDGNGRLYLGQEFAGMDVRVILEVLEEEADESEN